MRIFARLLFVLGFVVLPPSLAYAQAEITGVVRDTSSAVLPGVTVEASSPVLIEKARSVVTDGSGRYRIVDLRPGTYTVTFTLTGFGTVRREGVQLSGSVVASVDVNLQVGALEETITVSGAAPVVDVQSVTRQRVLSSETINAIPSGRLYSTLGVLVPGVSSNNADVGGALGDTMSSLTVHGSKNQDQRVMQNGVSTTTLVAGGNIGMSVPNVMAAQEVTIDTSAVSAELSTGGVRINFIPRDGGNQFRASVYAAFANEAMQADNFTERLRNLGLTRVDSIKKNWDLNPGAGGPILQDRLWYWTTGRHLGADTYAAGMFYNKNAFNPNAWTYEPDPSRPGFNTGDWRDWQVRLTWQASPRNKLAFTFDTQDRCRCPQVVAPTRAPEAAPDSRSPHQRLLHAEWSSPVTNRVLIEAVGLHRSERWGSMFIGAQDGEFTAAQLGLLSQMVPVVEQSSDLSYRGWPDYGNNFTANWFYRAAISYITGAHAVKAGFNNVHGYVNRSTYNFLPYSYRFNNGVPNRITIYATPYYSTDDQNLDLGLFVQDRWSLDRLTVTIGLRYDHFKTSFPEQQLGPALLIPTRNFTFAGEDNLNWHDITPRMGMSYDVFGTGRTAAKITLNKYLGGQTLNGLGSQPNPINRLVLNTTRSWNDANRNFVPECNLVDPALNGECGAMANPNFGSAVSGATFDPDLRTGWGNRLYNWEFSAGVQHEILPRVSVDVGYFRRWYGNFSVTDNLTLSAADFDRFSITAPLDPRLPDGGGYAIAGLYDVKPDRFGQPARNHNTLAAKYGKQIEQFNGIDVTVNARLQNGVLLQGGLSTGKTTTDNCEVVAEVPEALFINIGSRGGIPGVNLWQPEQWCRMETPFLTQVKFIGTYTIPGIDMLISGSYQSIPGLELPAVYNAPNSVVLPSLSRPLAGSAANQTINIVEPGTMYGERINQLDLRFGKVVRVARVRASLNFDLYNAFNADTVLTENFNFGAWRRPTSVLGARTIKLGVQFDY